MSPRTSIPKTLSAHLQRQRVLGTFVGESKHVDVAERVDHVGPGVPMGHRPEPPLVIHDSRPVPLLRSGPDLLLVGSPRAPSAESVAPTPRPPRSGIAPHTSGTARSRWAPPRHDPHTRREPRRSRPETGDHRFRPRSPADASSAEASSNSRPPLRAGTLAPTGRDLLPRRSPPARPAGHRLSQASCTNQALSRPSPRGGWRLTGQGAHPWKRGTPPTRRTATGAAVADQLRQRYLTGHEVRRPGNVNSPGPSPSVPNSTDLPPGSMQITRCQ